MRIARHTLIVRLTAASLLCALASPALAAGAGMPWEAPLTQIADSLTGPVARVAGIIAIVLTGLGFAFSDGGGTLRRMMGIVFGLAIAFSAATFFLPLFGFAGGAGF